MDHIYKNDPNELMAIVLDKKRYRLAASLNQHIAVDYMGVRSFVLNLYLTVKFKNRQKAHMCCRCEVQKVKSNVFCNSDIIIPISLLIRE